MYDKLTEIENLLTNNNVNEALNKITLLKEEINPNKNNINSSNEEIVKKEDVDQKIKEFQEKDILNEPIIFEFVKALDEGYDLLQGSRYIEGGVAINTPKSREVAIKLIHVPIINMLSGFKYTDTTNGFRAHSIKVFKDKCPYIKRKLSDRQNELTILALYIS